MTIITSSGTQGSGREPVVRTPQNQSELERAIRNGEMVRIRVGEDDTYALPIRDGERIIFVQREDKMTWVYETEREMRFDGGVLMDKEYTFADSAKKGTRSYDRFEKALRAAGGWTD